MFFIAMYVVLFHVRCFLACLLHDFLAIHKSSFYTLFRVCWQADSVTKLLAVSCFLSWWPTSYGQLTEIQYDLLLTWSTVG